MKRKVASGTGLNSLNVRSGPNVLGIVTTFGCLAFFLIMYLFFWIDQVPQGVPGLSHDRSSTYSVQILPTDLDDDALNKLPPSSFSYVAMIDAGSSGCRAHVYRYGKLGSLSGPLYLLPHHVSKKVKPGLSSFANNPSKAGDSLEGLISFLKEQVPESAWKTTPIWIKATAGLRMLDSSVSEAILKDVREFLGDSTSSPFLFRPSWAKVISGNEEGGFGWIAYNYLKKIIGPKRINEGKLNPYAVVEMGGASAQVSQLAPTKKEAEAIPSEYRFSFTIEGETFNLYTHSYLGFGAEQAREKLNKAILASSSSGGGGDSLVKDPCLYKGYTRKSDVTRKDVYEGPVSEADLIGDADTPQVGSGNGGGQCLSKVTSALFDANKGVECHKKTPKPHSFGCVHQPKFVADSDRFLVFENFYYISSAIAIQPANHDPSANGATSTKFPLLTSPREMSESAAEVCSKDWSTIQTAYPYDGSGKESNTKWCFAASYAVSFLTKGLGLTEDKVLTIQKEVGGSEIEWALGAAYKEAADFLKRTHLRPT